MPEHDLGVPKENPSKIQAVVERLRGIKHDAVGPMLDAQSALDPKAGILHGILPEAGTVISPAGYEYHFHGARVITGEQNFVNPHYHLKGEEPYHILTGTGEMNLGEVKDGQVVWREPREVVEGEEIEVQEGEVHSLRNPGETPLDFTFACPHNHLEDNSPEHPEGDRYFTMDLPNGIPPWYPKS